MSQNISQSRGQSLTQSLRDILQTVRLLWDQRDARERNLVALAAGVMFCGAVYGWVLDPAWQGIARLKNSLPITQAKAAQVQQLAAQLSAKNAAIGSAASASTSASTNGSANSQAAMQAALTSAGMNATASAVAPWTITVSSAHGEALWVWLGGREVSRSQFKRTTSGHWQGEVTLAQTQ